MLALRSASLSSRTRLEPEPWASTFVVASPALIRTANAPAGSASLLMSYRLKNILSQL